MSKKWRNRDILKKLISMRDISNYNILGNRIKSSWEKSNHKNPPRENFPKKILLNVVEREPVPTRVLNPNASYKPKQRIYRKTKLNFFLWRGGFYPGINILLVMGVESDTPLVQFWSCFGRPTYSYRPSYWF